MMRALLLLLPALASAANYDVGPSRELKQLQSVVARLLPGDTVRVDGDATYAGGVTFTRPGAAGRPIVIVGRPVNGKRPHLAGGTNTVHFQSDDTYKSGADHYVFQGFELTGGTSRCVFHQAGDLTLRDLIVHDCPKQGILGADVGAGSMTLEYSDVYACGGGDRDHQIYMSTDQVNRPGSVFRMRHNFVHDGRGGNNVKSRSERNEIHFNWIEGAFYHELELIGPDPDGVDDGWTPRLKREDSDVMGNVFWKKATAARPDGNFSVFRVGGDATGESHGRYRFTHNTIIAGTSAVFRCFDSLESVEAHNNVFHRPGGGLNMVREAEANWTKGSATFAGSNNWVVNGAVNVPASWTGTLQGADPGFADFSGGDFRPGPASPLRNAAAASPAGPAGSPFPDPAPLPPTLAPPTRARPEAPLPRASTGAVDIGAYEEGNGTPILRRPLSASTPVGSPLLRLGGGLAARQPGGEWRDMRGSRLESSGGD